jgi:hypothetical protein
MKKRKRPTDTSPSEITVCCHGSLVVLEICFDGKRIEVFLDDARDFARDLFQAADIAETRAEFEL